MEIFIASIIPFITALILWGFFKHKTVWWEFLIPFIVSIIVGVAFKYGGEYSRTKDIEYWTGIVKTATYYEAWDEWIYQTCESCTTDSEGNESCYTYDCSYRRYHDAYWEVVDNNGISKQIDKTHWDFLVKKFGNMNFVDMNRDYDINDGDSYVAYWKGSDKNIETMVTEHSYENRVQASDDIFNYPDIDTNDIKLFGLYEYPKIYRPYYQSNLLGKINGWKGYNRKLEILNSKLGKVKQLKVFVLLFRNKTREAALKQESYWKGGNKNEFVICIGLDNDDNVEWSHVFSWTENQICKVNVRTHIEEQKKLDLNNIIDYSYIELQNNFKRKPFKDFDYLTIEPSDSQLIWTIVITILVNIITSFIVVLNNVDESGYNRYNRRRWGRRY